MSSNLATPSAVAAHVGRVWRRGAECRDAIILRDCPPGWIRHDPNRPPGDVPSNAATRVMWTNLTAPLRDTDITTSRDELRRLQVSRAYIWLSPQAWNESADTLLARAGANPWPDVEYPTLVRRAIPFTTDRGREFTIRRISLDEAPAIFAHVMPWYGKDGIPAALQGIERGFAEFHVAFQQSTDGSVPISIGAIIPDGDFAYLGWMGTDPAFRGKGAQAALIAARVGRAAELGATWCTSETSSAVSTSLNNLQRAGFEVALRWRVYCWNP
jgi:GNAT superfamily N-acetyltransferase